MKYFQLLLGLNGILNTFVRFVSFIVVVVLDDVAQQKEGKYKLKMFKTLLLSCCLKVNKRDSSFIIPTQSSMF